MIIRASKLLSLCLIMLTSCDCTIRMSGKILDKETSNPISNAVVNLLNGQDIKESDDNGYFDVLDQAGFCKDPSIMVSKEGYKPFQLKISYLEDELTYTIKSESQSIDFDEPVYPDIKNRDTYVTGTWIEKWSQNFCSCDTLLIYLEKDNINVEIEEIKNEIYRR